MPGVGKKGVERLIAVAALKSEMVNPSALQARERFHLLHELRPFALRKAIQVRRIPAQNLRELENQKCPLSFRDAPRLRYLSPDSRPKLGKVAGLAELGAGDMFNCQSQQEQADRHIADK